MNICFVNSTHKWGGVKSWTLDAASGLAARGHRVLIIGRSGAFIEKAHELGLEATAVAFGPDFNPTLILKFTRLFTSRAIDRVVVNVGKDMRSAGVAAKLLGIPVIHRVGLAGDMENTFKVRAMHKWVRPHLLVPCAQIKQGLLSKLPYLSTQEITVILTGKIPTPQPPELVHPLVRFISTSQLNADKGHKDVLLALGELKRQGTCFEYHIVGTGRIEAELRDLARQMNLDDSIVWHGFQKNVRSLLREADIFLLPSYMEGLPNSLLEAMAEGLVCIARNVGGVSEIWPNEMHHLLLDTQSGAKEWLHSLHHLAKTPTQELTRMRHVFWDMARANDSHRMIAALELFAIAADSPKQTSTGQPFGHEEYPMNHEQYLKAYHRNHGLGPWRSLYLQILRHLDVTSVLEAGAGSPAFLAACPVPNKTAVDIADTLAETFRSRGITFRQKNLDVDDLSDLEKFQVIVCSDVFEHLMNPLRTLTQLHDILLPDGMLFSHVPNEFALRKMLKIMLGKKTSVNFHTKNLPEEWNDPHIRRFTDIGYRRMLEQKFTHNIKITQFRYSRFASFLSRFTNKIPYALEKGPTYISTNSSLTAKKIHEIIEQNKKALSNHK